MDSLLDSARNLKDQILSGGFSSPVTFTTPGGTITKAIRGLCTKHSVILNEFGAATLGNNARITISERTLSTTGYPVRNAQTEVSLKDHLVTWTDSEGITKTYVIREVWPTRTVGMISLVLGEYKNAAIPKKIIRWEDAAFNIFITAVPNPLHTQILFNGDEIPAEYALNDGSDPTKPAGTLTVPYVVGKSVLAGFIIEGNTTQGVVFNKANGTFNASAYGNFELNSNVSFNASIPIYQI